MKPVLFLILTSLLFTVVAHLFHTDEMYNEKGKLPFGKSSIANIQDWVETRYGYENIIMRAFIDSCVKMLFEITAQLSFIMARNALINNRNIFCKVAE